MPTLSNDEFWMQLYHTVALGTVTPVAVPKFRDQIVPVDSGDHQHFTLLYAPDPPESLILTVNGLAQVVGIENDYTLSGDVITMTVPVVGAFSMLGWYRH